MSIETSWGNLRLESRERLARFSRHGRARIERKRVLEVASRRFAVARCRGDGPCVIEHPCVPDPDLESGFDFLPCLARPAVPVERPRVGIAGEDVPPPSDLALPDRECLLRLRRVVRVEEEKLTVGVVETLALR